MKQLIVLLIVACVFAISCQQQPTKPTAATGYLPFYNTASFTPEWIEANSPKYDSIHTIPAFDFINQHGDTINQQVFINKIYVADFFFTSCPGICKKLTNNLSLVQKAFKNDVEVLLLSHSVTPETDTVARLQQYATQFGVIAGKWHLVTGNRQAIYNIARQAYFADEDLGVSKNENDFLHTENMVLIDKHKRIRGVYKGTLEADMQHLIADINTLKLEK
jgi:protein SCO1/2